MEVDEDNDNVPPKLPECEEFNITDVDLDTLKEIYLTSKFKTPIECLEEGKELDDVVMQFYLKYLKAFLENNNELKDKVKIFGTFFFSQLLMKTSTEDFQKLIVKLQKDLSKDFILIPIHLSDENHWLAVWVVRGLNKEGKAFQALLYMDSLDSYIKNKTRQKIFDTLRFIGDSALMELVEVKVPQQPNDVDWGLFTLQFIENIARNPDIAIQGAYDKDMTQSLVQHEVTRRKLKSMIDYVIKQL